MSFALERKGPTCGPPEQAPGGGALHLTVEPVFAHPSTHPPTRTPCCCCSEKVEVAEAWEARAADLLERQGGEASNLASVCWVWCRS